MVFKLVLAHRVVHSSCTAEGYSPVAEDLIAGSALGGETGGLMGKSLCYESDPVIN